MARFRDDANVFVSHAALLDRQFNARHTGGAVLGGMLIISNEHGTHGARACVPEWVDLELDGSWLGPPALRSQMREALRE